jgi:hypothetical protein
MTIEPIPCKATDPIRLGCDCRCHDNGDDFVGICDHRCCTGAAENRHPRVVLLQLIASLTLCDHMGDVGNDVTEALKLIGLEIRWDDWPDLGRALAKMGVTTLWGTSLDDGDGDDKDGEVDDDE